MKSHVGTYCNKPGGRVGAVERERSPPTNAALGPVFLERPGNLTGPESDFDSKVSRNVGRVLTTDEVHFVSLAYNFTVQLSKLLKLPLEWKTKQLNGSGNYRELRETGPWSDCGPVSSVD